MTNYMYYDYANSKVAKIKEDQIEYENARSMKSYFDKQCLENGSTLEGRKRSFIYLVHKKKFIPITISLSPLRIYFPTAPIKDPSCKWVNFSSIKEILYHKKHVPSFSMTIHVLHAIILNESKKAFMQSIAI